MLFILFCIYRKILFFLLQSMPYAQSRYSKLLQLNRLFKTIYKRLESRKIEMENKFSHVFNQVTPMYVCNTDAASVSNDDRDDTNLTSDLRSANAANNGLGNQASNDLHGD